MRKKLLLSGLLMTVLGFPAMAAPALSFETNSPKKTAGRTSAEWADAWWGWAQSWEENKGPLWSSDGADCLAGKQNEVVFIGGSYTNDPVLRRCQVDAGSRLFFPIFTTHQVAQKGNCSSLKQGLGRELAGIQSMFLEVDGGIPRSLPQLQDHRITTCSMVRQPSGAKAPEGQDGYWFMTQPLKPGKHQFRFGGNWGDYEQDVVYEVEVR